MSGITSPSCEESSAADRDGETKLGLFSAALVESACLAALIAAPLFFNLHSERVFEEDKVPLLRSLALLVVLGLVVRRQESGGGRWGSLWRTPLVRPALAWAVVYGISTLASTSPLTSLLGGYHRLQGAYTFASYLPFFFAPILLGCGPRQAGRLVSVVVFASVPVALYGLAQYLGYDPMPWGDSFQQRVYSTAGNPIFLGAYLILPIPLTVARIVERARTARVAALGYLAVLGLQLAALLLSQSRGPLVGLAAGLAVFGLVWSALWLKRRALVLIIASIAAVALFGAVLRTAPGTNRGFARLADLINVEHGSGKVRTLIWQAASDLILGSGPGRFLVGYGPDTELTALTPHYPPELGQYESRTVIPDRAHNEAIDATIATGVLGSAAEFVFFIAFFGCVLGALGLTHGRREGAVFALLLAAGGAAGAFVPYWLDGSLRFSGLGVHGGIGAGLLLFLAGRALVPPRGARSERRPEDLLLAGLLAAGTAHLVEIGLGIAVAAPRLYFWTYAGIAAALALGREEGARRTRPRVDPALAALAGLALVILSVDFYTPSAKPRALAILWLGVALPTWIAGALLLAPAASGARGRLDALARYAASSLLPWAAFAAALFGWLGWQPPPSGDTAELAIRYAYHIGHTVSIVYVAVLALVALAAALALPPRRPLPPLWTRSAAHAFLYAVLAIAAGIAIADQNLSVSRADVLAKQATYYDRSRRFDLAAAVVAEASRLRPSVDQYYSSTGREYMEDARLIWHRDPAHGRELLARGQAALERARATQPALLDNTRNLARLQRGWADLATDPDERAAHLQRADALYEASAVLAPTSAPLLNEWALMHFEMHDAVRARSLLDRSFRVDPHYVTTFWLRANLRAADGDLSGALEDYDNALALKPWLDAALSGKGAVLVRLGRLDEAIQVNRQVLQYKPKDTISLRNLALLFRDKGDLKSALDFARRARASAPAGEKPPLDAFIAEIERDLENR